MQSQADVALIGDEKADLQQRILRVLWLGTHWATSATSAEKQQYLNCCLPITLGLLIRLDWPAGADFDKSVSKSGAFDICPSKRRSTHFRLMPKVMPRGTVCTSSPGRSLESGACEAILYPEKSVS
jgi:hypothetical protein